MVGMPPRTPRDFRNLDEVKASGASPEAPLSRPKLDALLQR